MVTLIRDFAVNNDFARLLAEERRFALGEMLCSVPVEMTRGRRAQSANTAEQREADGWIRAMEEFDRF